MLIITADELPRIVACNGSLGMPQHQPFQEDDTVKNEGIAAHWLIEQVFKRNFGTDELVERPAPNGVFISEAMVEHVTPTLDAWKGKGEVEANSSYGDNKTYQVNGRTDHREYDVETATLFIDDFKYGWGLIEPDSNWTLLSHAFAWLFANPSHVVHQVTLRIFQPRPYHPLGKIRSVTYPIEQLWTEFWPVLEATLTNPTQELHTGSQCRKCPALATCPASRKAEMNSIDVSELAYVADMDNGSLAFLLDQTERAIKVLEGTNKALSEMAMHRIKRGEIVPGRAVQKDLTNKSWKKSTTVEIAQILTGKNLSKSELVTPAAAVKLGVPQEVVDALCERREKGWKLSKIDAKSAVLKNFGEIL